MSFRHKVLIGAAALTVAIVSSAPLTSFAEETMALERVASDLGFAYTYLPYENAVSLYRPGATIVVRPGDAFFSANERREPVYGVVPFYRNNDVYVSRAFVDEIRELGHGFGRVEIVGVPTTAGVLAGGNAPSPVTPTTPRGIVDTLAATYDATSDTIVVRGRATAGSRIALVVKSTLAQDLPVVIVDRAITFATTDGTFAATLTSGSDHFAQSRLVVEAAGNDNVAPVVASVAGRK